MKKSITKKKEQTRRIYFLRILMTSLSILMLAWIFSNSLKTGAESSGQSGSVTLFVQRMIKFIAPNSALANATGESYEKLHSFIRTLAHFGEFALLGAFIGWTYRSYTNEKTWLFLPLFMVLFIPITDEHLQSFTPGRGTEIFDVWVDTAGALSGLMFALISVWLLRFIILKRKENYEAGKFGNRID